MNEGRDLRNKVCFVDDHAFAVGGLNSKAEKFNHKEKRWIPLSEYPLSDNLDSWACSLTYIPQEYSNLVAKTAAVSSGLNPLLEESKEVDRILEQERLIDLEIKQEIEKYKLNKLSGVYLEEDEQEQSEVFADSNLLSDERNKINFNGQRRLGVAIEANQPESQRYVDGSVEEQLSATVRARAELSGSASVASNNKPSRLP